MEQTLTKQMAQLKNDAIDAIMAGDKTKAYGMVDVEYASDDGGYMADTLALITDDFEVYFISEEYTYNPSYDYKEDEDEIAFGPYGIDGISIYSLICIASKITGDGSFVKRYSDIMFKKEFIMNKVINFIPIPPTEILFEYDCHWRSMTVERISSDLLKAGDTTINLNDPMLVIDDEEMLKLADAVNYARHVL